jgi:hypothetical protein
MATTFTGTSPGLTYKDILHLNNSNAGVTGSLLALNDGNGVTTALQVSTTGIGSTGTIVATGAVTGSNLSGTNTGDQTITLTGDITGTGTGSFATTIAAGAVDVAMLAGGTDGELITWDASGNAATVAVGTVGQVLTSGGAGVAPTMQTLAVAVSEIADGTDGELITWDASGNAATVGVGTATHVLTSNGAGAAPTFQAAAGGAWAYVSTATASTSSSITFTGIDSSADVWMLEITDLVMTTNNDTLNIRTSTDGGSSYDSGATDYRYALGGSTEAPAFTGLGSAGDSRIRMSAGIGSSEIGHCRIYLHNPANSSNDTVLSIQSRYVASGGACLTMSGTGYRNSAADVDAIEFSPFAGATIASGVFRLYKLADS